MPSTPLSRNRPLKGLPTYGRINTFAAPNRRISTFIHFLVAHPEKRGRLSQWGGPPGLASQGRSMSCTRYDNPMRPLALSLLILPLCAQPPQRQLAREVFKQLIEIDTTDSIGDNTRAAEAMAARFRAAGFAERDIQVLAPAPRKGNLVVRLHGTGAARPILFIGHLDVVEAKRSDWSFDPFVFRERDGYFYGRGTSDMKGDDAILVATFLRMKREGFQPVRDMILALTSDEEGGAWNGIDWLVKNHRDLIDAEFCGNSDGGGGDIKNGRSIYLSMQAAEKVFLSFKLEVTNSGGHSSLPTEDNAIYHLAEGSCGRPRWSPPEIGR